MLHNKQISLLLMLSLLSFYSDIVKQILYVWKHISLQIKYKSPKQLYFLFKEKHLKKTYNIIIEFKHYYMSFLRRFSFFILFIFYNLYIKYVLIIFCKKIHVYKDCKTFSKNSYYIFVCIFYSKIIKELARKSVNRPIDPIINISN